MLGTHVFVAQFLRLFAGIGQHMLGLVRKRQVYAG